MKKFIENNFNPTTTKRQRGVALLFAVLLTSMLLLVALGIVNITYKELLFSGEAKDSDRAFFAADTGIECALFLDKQGVYVATGTPTPPSDLCNGLTFAVDGLVHNTTGTSIYTFMIPVPANNTCSDVVVDKNFAVGPDSYTKIVSVGYNLPTSGATCTAGIPAGSTRVVSRALTTKYKNP
jgi:hypothetical protein